MFGLITFLALLLASVVVLALVRRLAHAEQRAAAAETEAAMSWGKGYQAGAAEQHAKLAREGAASYDKGFENGWNACVTQFEDVGVPIQARAA
jgi:Tfp pilus assembly protein PilV